MTSGEPSQPADRPPQILAWPFVLVGALAIIAGIVALVYPGKTLSVIALIFGIYLVIVGLLDMIGGWGGESGQRDWPRLLLGALALIAGIIAIIHPGASLEALVLVLGIFLILAGIVHFAQAVATDTRRYGPMIMGLIELIGGIIIVVNPGIGVVTIALLFGITLIVRGVLLIALGLALRG